MITKQRNKLNPLPNQFQLKRKYDEILLKNKYLLKNKRK